MGFSRLLDGENISKVSKIKEGIKKGKNIAICGIDGQGNSYLYKFCLSICAGTDNEYTFLDEAVYSCEIDAVNLRLEYGRKIVFSCHVLSMGDFTKTYPSFKGIYAELKKDGEDYRITVTEV